ncbi:N4-gp56 family major capsid protein [Halomonas koreensis]|uniref:N4-gp56 family major capsid protein n=1 Tax=Halomonas koreensis TaxID=245385 RepID=A0ABU1G4N8_9GAMM|nr:N4-gp56 family major capsid protein [Halomonas koreensis]MDR5867929.1 N4-gp56 family major capsid protein [Halomonas koreensis]
MSQTNYSGLNQRTTYWAMTQHLKHAEPIVCLAKYGMSKPVPKNKSESVKFRRPVPLALSKTPLTEGAAPTSKAMQYEDVSVTLDQYGDVVELTDKVQDLAEDPVLKDATELTGEQSAETIESLMWGILRGGTNVFYANGSARTDVNSVVSLAKQRAVTRALKVERAKKVTKMVSSSVKYGTEAIDAAFIAVAHTHLEADIRDMPGFVPTEKYGSMKPLPYEIGKVEDVRYVLTPVLEAFEDAGGDPTTNGVITTSGGSPGQADVYPIVYFGQDAYGHIALKGKEAVEMKIRQPGQIDSNDKLGQVGWVGWKTYWKGFRANEAWMVRLEVAASDL